MTGIRHSKTWTPRTAGAWSGIDYQTYRDAPGLAKSALDPMRKCPLAYKHAQTLPPRPATDAMKFGTLLHAALLDGVRDYDVRPDGMKFTTKEGRAWKEEHPVNVTPEQDQFITASARAVRANPLVWDLIKGSRREVSVFAEYGDTFMKGRVDLMTSRGPADVKTVADASDRALSNAIYNFGWHVQAALYWKLCAILGLPHEGFWFIAIEKGPLPLLNVKMLKPSALDVGLTTLDGMLIEWSQCRKTDTWLDYTGESVGEVDIPHWAYPDEMGQELTMNGQTITL